ncbi:MAG: 16S rRNA (guanine(527)-N(7))-methyltransferase RsmG [Roseinatronobacter sp.]
MTKGTLPIDVSRETIERLQDYVELLLKWNAKINLIGPATSSDVWGRHINDSAQIFALSPPSVRHWVDLGSGGGLPGLVVAIIGQAQAPDARFTLIESDQRKAAFLLTVARTLHLDRVTVLPERIELAPPQGADIVSARALAPLPQLVAYVHRHLSQIGVALLPKGRSYETELAAARQDWHFDLTTHESQTDPMARVLEIKDISRA